jgi:hypothetical protein
MCSQVHGSFGEWEGVKSYNIYRIDALVRENTYIGLTFSTVTTGTMTLHSVSLL